jgi:hypothetical protein
LYGNDAEIFDFRPGRYEMESAPCAAGEWRRIEYLLATLRGDGHFQFIRPSQVLELLQAPGAGNRLRLGSPEQPIPVKKQGKYNITRWSVTGRDDLGINTACWRICAALETRPGASDDDWRQLCRLWSSDFRTHITATRWNAYRRELVATERAVGVQKPRRAPARKLALLRAAPPCASLQNRVERDGRFLTVETDAVKVRLNCRRGLAIDALWFQGSSLNPWCGTLNHGYYDDIQWGADFYTGHVILEVPGRPKVTDLNPVEPVVIPEPDRGSVRVEGEVITPLGPIRKTLRIGCDAPQVELCYWLGWRKSLSGSLRVGHFTLNPLAFDRNTLFYRTHNGGKLPETFRLRGTDFDHGSPVSSLVSASQALGMTEQLIDIGDARHAVRVEVDKQSAALIGMITYRTVGNTYFLRLALSAGELDETRHAAASTTRLPLICRISKAEG